MRAWKIAKVKRATDLSGMGAAIEGGPWNDQDVPAVYMGLTPAICYLETFMHAGGEPAFPMTITCFELPAEMTMYFEPDRKHPPGADCSFGSDSVLAQCGNQS